MDVDPVASMRCWAIDIELGGRTYEVPALPAVDWWPVLVSDDLGLILDMIVSTQDGDLDEKLLSGDISSEELAEALTDALEQAAGRSKHVAMVLAISASVQWHVINGVLAQRGFRWDVMPLGAALDAIHLIHLGNLDKEGREKFQAALDNESLTQIKGKGKRKASQRVVSEFEAMAGPRPTGGVTATGEQSGSEPPKTPPRSQPRRRSAP